MGNTILRTNLLAEHPKYGISHDVGHMDSHMTTTVLVTGADGFVGLHLVRKLKQMKRRVVATDLIAHDEIVHLDVRRRTCVEEVFRAVMPNVIVHLAATVDKTKSDPYDLYANNILGTINICDVGTRLAVRKIVFMSSVVVCGNVAEKELPITEETPVEPITPYAASKACGEILVSEHVMRKKIVAVMLRPTTIFGPGQKSNLIQEFMDKALNGIPLEIYDDGSHTREFVFVEDAVDAITAAIDMNDLPFDKFLVATGAPVRTGELVEKICSMVGRGSVRHVDAPTVMLSQRYDISRAQTYLKWRPRVSLEDGLALTLQWRRKMLRK